jgi:hypothetical protein
MIDLVELWIQDSKPTETLSEFHTRWLAMPKGLPATMYDAARLSQGIAVVGGLGPLLSGLAGAIAGAAIYHHVTRKR